MPVTLLLVPDEEIGSPASRSLTERLALACSAVLVLEPAAGPAGACKTSRKGVAHYTLRIQGRAAHAGLDFERGASAIVEAAHQVIAISRLSRPAKGLTLNPGLISGGARPNVVAELPKLSSMCASSPHPRRRASMLESTGCARSIPGAACKFSGASQRAPFERSPATVRLYRIAAQAAAQLGFQLAEAAVGGGSDGNFTAALGIPTLDGLGAVGDGAHALHEFVAIREMPRRSALLAELITRLAAG